MNLFYTPNITSDEYTLNEQESVHIHKVLRKHPGDIIHLTDGEGYFYKAEIIEADKRSCKLKILSKKEGTDKRGFKIHVAIAPTKNMDRLEWFIEKTTEIGIDEISIVSCFHSERKIVKNERLEKIKIAACKQSLKSNFPVINELVKFKTFISQDFKAYEKFIAYIDKDVTKGLKDLYKKEKNVLIMIGPEGDFSKEEVEEAKKQGFTPISLGRSRLRTETAGVVACNVVHFINER